MPLVDKHISLAQFLTEQYQQFPEVEAVGISGSVMSGLGNEQSDIDLYIFGSPIVPVEDRIRIAKIRGYTRADFNNQYWDTGDEWFDAPTGIAVDEMFWNVDWLEERLASVLEHHQANTGYTTCHWHTMRQMNILFDRSGRLTALKTKSQVDYPEPLRKNIIEKNHPLLHTAIPAYTNQLKKAISRHDLVSITHRFAEYLASYFDILFALNRIPHPGEKRLIPFAVDHCQKLPQGFETDLTALLSWPGAADKAWLERLDHLNQAMDALLGENGF